MSARSLITLFVGLAIGLSLADVDQVFFFLRHRSAVTHSVLLPFLGYMLVQEQDRKWLKIGIVGISIGMSIHLCFDLFPRSWYGYALINMPLLGQIGSVGSICWIIVNTVACFYLALLLLNSKTEAYTALGIGIVGFMFSWGMESYPSLWTLTALMFCMAIASFLPNKIIDGADILRRVTHREQPGAS